MKSLMNIQCLKKINMCCANYPIGFWKYDKDLKILPKENIKLEDLPKLENKVNLNQIKIYVDCLVKIVTILVPNLIW